MEPPTKRPRFGPAPFEDDDPDDDELNSRPEEVNARRDPGLKLERSRAFAALKLKSAWENIFDKYGKDFTGVGDEIDLRTGEIVVNNGHLQSLKDAEIGGEDGEEEGEDGDSEDDVPLNEEEEKLQGKPDNRLSQLGQLALPSIPAQIGPPSIFGGGWPGPTPLLRGGGSPGMSTMMYPGHMQFGGFSMQYGTPIPMPSTDPNWSAPELPSPLFGGGFVSGQGTALVTTKKARLSLTAARENDDDEGDDILRGLPDVSQSGGVSDSIIIRKKLLLPRPPPEKVSKKRGRKPAMASPKHVKDATELGKHPKASKSVVEKKPLENEPVAERPGASSPGVTAAELDPNSRTGVKDNGATADTVPTETSELTRPDAPVLEATEEESSPGVWGKTNIVPPLQPGDPDVFVNLSDGGEKLTRKPRNQTLRVEIVARNLPDTDLFTILTPEPSEEESPGSQGSESRGLPEKNGHTLEKDKPSVERVPVASELKGQTPESRVQTQKASTRVFARNIVDPAYAFSDEDEPALPRKGVPQRTPGKVGKALKAGDDVPLESLAVHERGSPRAKTLPDTDDAAVERAPSPTLSVQLDTVVDCHATGQAEPSAEGRDKPGLIVENSEESSDIRTSRSDEIPSGRMARRKSMRQAEKPSVLRQSPKSSTVSQSRVSPETGKAIASRKRKQSLSSKGTSTSITERGSHHETNPQEEPADPGAQTFAEAQPVDSPYPKSASLGSPLEIPESEPPAPSSEHPQRNHDRLPSPTLTDPSSADHQTTPSKQPTPSTPTKLKAKPKTPVNRLPKSHPPPPTTTTATKPKTKAKRKSLLSLLPPNNPDSDEDELSIPPLSTPVPSTATLVRLTALSSGGKSSSHKNATTTKKPKPTTSSSVSSALKRGVLKPTAGNTAGRGHESKHKGVSTPSAKRKRSEAAVGAGTGVYTGSGGGLAEILTPSSRARLMESEMVQTPGGTMRRCGEGGFRCERDFCFVCL